MRSRTIVIAAFVLAIVFAVSSVAMARGFGKSDKGYHSRQGLMGLRTVMELNLSDSQKDQALKIMEKYQNNRAEVRESLIKERDSLRTAIQADEFNEGNTREVFQKASSIREDMFIERAKMMTEMKKILTPDQIKVLNERKAERLEKMKGHMDHRRAMVDKWSRDCLR